MGQFVSASLPALKYRNYYIDVPADAAQLMVSVVGGSGDLDLFMKQGSKLSGDSHAALLTDSDAASDANYTAWESIRLTKSTTPPLAQGRWYAAVANFNDTETAFHISALLSTTEALHTLTIEAEPEAAIPGTLFSWHYGIGPASAAGSADLYAAFLGADGSLQYLLPYGTSPVPYPYASGIALSQAMDGELLADYALPSVIPAGDYTLLSLLTTAGGTPFALDQWASDLAATPMRLAALSPSQQAFVKELGYPDMFVKTFDEEGGKLRIDETWVYLDEGVSEYFNNGVFMEEATVDTTSITAPATALHPEDYRFDTTPADIEALHGEPTAIQAAAPDGDEFYGTFPADEYHVYDGVVFGFRDGRLISVLPGRQTP